MSEIKEQKKKETDTIFKHYYSNEDFRKKHNAYMRVYVPCPNCGREYQRCNMTVHKRSLKCQRITIAKEEEEKKILKEKFDFFTNVALKLAQNKEVNDKIATQLVDNKQLSENILSRLIELLKSKI